MRAPDESLPMALPPDTAEPHHRRELTVVLSRLGSKANWGLRADSDNRLIEVTDGSPAHVAKLQCGDVITQIDGKRVELVRRLSEGAVQDIIMGNTYKNKLKLFISISREAVLAPPAPHQTAPYRHPDGRDIGDGTVLRETVVAW